MSLTAQAVPYFSSRCWTRPPAYAPELNPAEGLWSNLKSQELANRCETHVQMVTIAARQGANRVRSQRSLLLGFLRHAGLQL
jgi:transposase